jgi:hypothetical protein
VPKSPASLKTFVLAAAVALLALSSISAPAGRAQVREEARQRPRRVSPTPTPPPPVAPAPKAPQQKSAAGQEVDEDDVVRIETQLVSVPAIVTDRTGRPLTGLSAADFQIFEDGRPQKIANFSTTEAPFEVALLLDTSAPPPAPSSRPSAPATASLSSPSTQRRRGMTRSPP